MFLLKHLIPLLSENLRMYRSNVDESFLEAIARLLMTAGGFFDRSVFIPGETREN
jgi:hypothetical protein